MDSTPARPREPVDADGWFDAYFDGEHIRIAEGFRAGVNHDRVRSVALGSLHDLLTGERKHPISIDLEQACHVVRVAVTNGSAGIGAGPLFATADYLVPARALVVAAISHLSE